MGANVKSKRSKVKVTGNKNVKKSFFAHILVKSGSMYVMPIPKLMITGPFYTYRIIHFTNENA